MPNPSVLIADDSEDFAEMLKLLLETQGANCSVAHTGAAALDAMRSRNFDLVVLDVGLPDIDGLEVARRARRLNSPPLRLVGLSGYSRPRGAEEAGFDAYFVKPLSPETLAALLPRADRGHP